MKSGFRRTFLSVYSFGRELWVRKDNHNLSVYAASSSFYLMLSLVPFLVLLVQLFRLLPDVTIQDFISKGYLPPFLTSFLDFLINEIEGTISPAVISVTALAALWAAGKGTSSIRVGLLSATDRQDNRGYLRGRIFGSIYVVLFLIVLAASMILLMFGRFLTQWLRSLLPQLSDLIFFFIDMRPVAEGAFLFGLFLLLYHFIDKRRSWRYALPGAVGTTIGWMAFTGGFSLYLSYSGGMSALYGSMAAIVVILLWLYVCMEILFLGAEANEILWQRKNIGH